MNQFRFLVISGFILCVAVGCIEHDASELNHLTKSEQAFVEKQVDSIKYNQYSVYEGILPCNHCIEIQQRLVLKGDTMGVFRLTEIFKKGDQEADGNLVTIGQWAREKKNSKEILRLSQGTLMDSIRQMEYESKNNELIQITSDGERITNTSAYHLKLTKKMVNQ